MSKLANFASSEEYIEHEVKLRLHAMKFNALEINIDKRFDMVDVRFSKMDDRMDKMEQSINKLASMIRICGYIGAVIAAPVLGKYFGLV